MRLYPKLPRTLARELASRRAKQSLEDLGREATTVWPGCVYSPTGGARVSENQLQTLRDDVLNLAVGLGFPRQPTDVARRAFDRELAINLHGSMQLSAHEASSGDMWAFLGCVVLPDVVRWRFPGDDAGSRVERFLGGARGTRNAFGRVWWRAFTLQDQGSADQYEILGLLGEDEFVQLMERPRLSGSRRLVRLIAREFLDTVAMHPGFRRSEMLREVVKRLRRLLPHVAFEALDTSVAGECVRRVFEQVVRSATDPAFGRRPHKESPARII